MEGPGHPEVDVASRSSRGVARDGNISTVACLVAVRGVPRRTRRLVVGDAVEQHPTRMVDRTARPRRIVRNRRKARLGPVHVDNSEPVVVGRPSGCRRADRAGDHERRCDGGTAERCGDPTSRSLASWPVASRASRCHAEVSLDRRRRRSPTLVPWVHRTMGVPSGAVLPKT